MSLRASARNGPNSSKGRAVGFACGTTAYQKAMSRLTPIVTTWQRAGTKHHTLNPKDRMLIFGWLLTT
eukprot:4364890-Prorocentrum_lima.AAC.1